MVQNKTLLFLGAGPAQETAIVHARNLGYSAIAVDADSTAVGLIMADDYNVGDICDPNFVVACATKHNVDGIVCISIEASIQAAAEASLRLGLSSISVDAAAVAVNKLKQRQLFEGAGLIVPDFNSFDSVDRAIQLANEIGYPIVVKPSDSTGSKGVRYVSDQDSVGAAAIAAMQYSKTGIGIVEQFVEGPEISVEGFVVHGRFTIICLSDKQRTDPPYLLDTSVHFPTALSNEQQDQVKEIATIAVQACGLDNCPVHMELIMSRNGPMIVELAARGPGFKVFTDILPYVSGVDTIHAQIQLALGEDPDISVVNPLKGAVVSFLSPKEGRLTAVSGLEEARAIKGVKEVEVYASAGDELGQLTCGADRLGHIIAHGNNRAQAESIVERASNMITFEVE